IKIVNQKLIVAKTMFKQSLQSQTSLYENEDFLESNSNIYNNNTSVSTELKLQQKKARKGGLNFDK
ncbi:1902_t:CDS:1, partial [Cetraspora pellucida]